MACLSACLYYHPSVITQHHSVLSSWAIEGLSSVDAAYSKESSRLLAMLSSDAPSWEKTVHKLCDELKFLIMTAFTPFNTPGERESV